MRQLAEIIKPVRLTRRFVRALVPRRYPNSNKATYGNVLNIAGSYNYRGAAYLSSIAALKSGAGYATLAAIPEVLESAAAHSPDIVGIELQSQDGSIEQNEHQKILQLLPKYKALSLGCGMFSYFCDNRGVKLFFGNLLKAIAGLEIPVIIDADGLSMLAESPRLPLPPRTILTPHPLELSRLLKTDVVSIQENRVRFAREAALLFSCVVVLKGNHSVITDGQRVFINSTGNSALSKAGSGDVLTGIIAGLCAQGLSCLDAAVLAVYIHGKAGDMAAKDLTEYGVLASEQVLYIPLAIKTLI